MNFFKKKQSVESVKLLRDALVAIRKEPNNSKGYQKAVEDASKHLVSVKNALTLNRTNEPNIEQVSQFSKEIETTDLFILLMPVLLDLEFETKKDVSHIFTSLMRRQLGSRFPMVDYLISKMDIVFAFIDGYQYCDIHMCCGNMLRECIRHESLASHLLGTPHFFKLFTYIESETFDLASDAFSTFKDLLTRHKSLVAVYLESNYEVFFDQHYSKLLDSSNYVTKRQSIKLLGELLLDRANFNTMTRYISDPENLKTFMKLLRNKSKNLQFEAFHVFKIFVANPKKPKPINDIFLKNQSKLIVFLEEFQVERNDEQFADEKAYLIQRICALTSPQPPTSQ